MTLSWPRQSHRCSIKSTRLATARLDWLLISGRLSHGGCEQINEQFNFLGRRHFRPMAWRHLCSWGAWRPAAANAATGGFPREGHVQPCCAEYVPKQPAPIAAPPCLPRSTVQRFSLVWSFTRRLLCQLSYTSGRRDGIREGRAQRRQIGSERLIMPDTCPDRLTAWCLARSRCGSGVPW